MLQEGHRARKEEKEEGEREWCVHLVLQVGCQVSVLWGVRVVQQLPVAWVH